jgi:capsule biosynthesis phosphatase
MRICIDIDGVICKLKKENELYQDLMPVDGSVERIMQLKESGHYIILYTARRMKTHNANIAKVIADIGKITLDWLERHNIPYDEIIFGKPWADVYIDDNAFRFHNWEEIMANGTSLPVSNESKFSGKN